MNTGELIDLISIEIQYEILYETMHERKYYIVMTNIDGETELDITSVPPLRGDNHHPGINETIHEKVNDYLEHRNVDLEKNEAFHLGKIFVDNDTGEIVETDLRDPEDRNK